MGDAIVTLSRTSVGTPTTSASVRMPAGTRVTARCDMTALELGDVLKSMTVAVEVSADEGATWLSGGSFTMGGALVRRIAGGQPAVTVGAPAAGTLVRLHLIPGARAVTTGAVLEVD